MAEKIPQKPDKAKQAKADAAASNSVPELRDAVQLLADDVIELRAQLKKLIR